MASLCIVGLVFSPVGNLYDVMFYIFGCFSILSLVILVFFFKQTRYEPDWPAILMADENEGALFTDNGSVKAVDPQGKILSSVLQNRTIEKPQSVENDSFLTGLRGYTEKERICNSLAPKDYGVLE